MLMRMFNMLMLRLMQSTYIKYQGIGCHEDACMPTVPLASMLICGLHQVLQCCGLCSMLQYA